MALIDYMHRNKPNIIYLIFSTYLISHVTERCTNGIEWHFSFQEEASTEAHEPRVKGKLIGWCSWPHAIT